MISELSHRDRSSWSLFSVSIDRYIYCKCIVHHTKFCPVNLRLISCRALGSLDSSSGGTVDVLADWLTGRGKRFPLILRWQVFGLNECALGFTIEVVSPDITAFACCKTNRNTFSPFKPNWDQLMTNEQSVNMFYYLNDFHQETTGFRLWLVGKRKMFRDLSRALDLPTSESLACAAPFRFSFQGRAAVQP